MAVFVSTNLASGVYAPQRGANYGDASAAAGPLVSLIHMQPSPTDPHPCFVEPARRRRGLASPGVAFCGGKLYHFDYHAIEVVRPWPPQGWRKVIGRPGWTHFRPDINLSLSFVGTRKKRDRMADQGDELEEIPSEANQILIAFPPPWGRAARERDAMRRFIEEIPGWAKAQARRFRVRQFHVLSLLARCPGAADLAASSPSLAWMLASSWCFHRPAVRRPLRSARSLLRGRQRQIAEWLGFPGEEWVVRALRRVPPRVCDVSSMLHLRGAFRSPEAAQFLQHAPTLNRCVIRILSEERLRAHVTPQFLADVAIDRPNLLHWGTAHTLTDVLEMFTAVRPRDRMPMLESTAQLTDLHEELVAQVNGEGTFLSIRDLAIPPPPIPGTEDIVPLCSVDALVAEGREMKHCVGSYGRRVAAGVVFCYALLRPERGTICIQRAGLDDFWVLLDARGRSNRALRPETRRAIERWINGGVDTEEEPAY